MKNWIIIFWSILFTSLAVHSSTLYAQSPYGNIKFKTKEWKHVQYMHNNPEEANYNHSFKIAIPISGDSSTCRFVENAIIQLAITPQKKSASINEALKGYFQEQSNNYLEGSAMYEEALAKEKDPKRLDWINLIHSVIQEDSVAVSTYYFDILVVQNHWLIYQGGASAMMGSQSINLDLRNKKEIHFRDIFKPEANSKLIPLLKENLRKKLDVETMEDVEFEGYNIQKITIPKRFLIEPLGIRFIYEKYDIGPGAFNEPDIFIPYTEMLSVMRTEQALVKNLLKHSKN